MPCIGEHRELAERHEAGAQMNKRTSLTLAIWAVGACALAVRLALVIWAGIAPETPLTGGSDTFAYQALGDSIVLHHGLSYAGMPTALRPPLYPLFLAFGQFVAGANYRVFARAIQFFAGILLAFACAKAARKLGGSAAVAFAIALAAPTLVFFSAEILSETFAALIAAAFLCAMVAEANPVWIGALIGIGMLERFNLAALAVAYLVYEFAAKKPSDAARRVALAGAVAVALVSPWFVRNLIVFHGQVVYSTHTGTNLLQGILTPDGRTQRGDVGKLEAAAGWTISDIETNSPSRTAFPPEPELDRMAMKAAVAQLAHANPLALGARKLGYFWLSLDQLLRTQDLSRKKRGVRVLGIFVYWVLLAIGVVGWWRLRSTHRDAALLFASYAAVVTAMHLPFVMNTRIRAPLVEPALAILVGLALAGFAGTAETGPEGEGSSGAPLTQGRRNS